MDPYFQMGCQRKTHYGKQALRRAKRAAHLAGDHARHGCRVEWCPVCGSGYIVVSNDDRVGRRGGRS